MPKRFNKTKSSPTWIDDLVDQYAARPNCNETSFGVQPIIAPSAATTLPVSMEDKNEMIDIIP